MELLTLRSNGLHQDEGELPLMVYTAGTEHQSTITRLGGFSANQLFLTFSGTGRFRLLSQDKWDILQPDTLLYIPAGTPHEYMPAGNEPWFVGYVTYFEQEEGILWRMGFGSETFFRPLRESGRLYSLIKRVWSLSGPRHDAWAAAETLLAVGLELKRQMIRSPEGSAGPGSSGEVAGIRHSAVESAVRFLHDHLERDITMTELAAHVGYSQKQLTRLFRQSLQTTPLKYLQQLRLRTAAVLLGEHPDMTIRQAAVYVGMEPVYFARLFRRTYGMAPSRSREPG